jgi:hypothetical protein
MTTSESSGEAQDRQDQRQRGSPHADTQRHKITRYRSAAEGTETRGVPAVGGNDW